MYDRKNERIKERKKNNNVKIEKIILKNCNYTSQSTEQAAHLIIIFIITILLFL